MCMHILVSLCVCVCVCVCNGQSVVKVVTLWLQPGWIR